MKLPIKETLIVLLIFGVVFLITDKVHTAKKIKQLERSEQLLAQDNRFLIKEIKGTKEKAAIQEQIIIGKNSDLAELSDSIKDLKNLKSQVRIVTRTQYISDTVEIPSSNLTEISDSTYLKLPYMLSDKNRWYNYQFRFTESGKVIRDSLTFYSEFLVSFGYEKKFNLNPFNKNKPIVYFRDLNPHTEVTEMQNIVIEDFKPRKVSIELQAGYGITSDGFSPYLGIGIGYQLIRF